MEKGAKKALKTKEKSITEGSEMIEIQLEREDTSIECEND